ncbi:MAG TPA: methyltransferase domain-containing protein [Polyangiales bacterium]|nr:methyltransferase domain-containing protein [Polyangiales bacterium]
MTQLSATESHARNVSLELDSPELATTYDVTSTRQFDHGKVLIAALAPKPGERALDIGCGTGRLGEYVANLVAPSGEVIGVDPLPLRIDIAGRKNPRFSASVGRAEDLSKFKDESFDLAYSNSVFHWVLDKPTALREALRVLKRGGRFGVNSADADRSHQSQKLVREVLLEEGLSKSDGANALGTNYRVTAQELTKLLKEAGFKDVDVKSHTFVDAVEGVDDLIAWSTSSSFGNFLSDLSSSERSRVREGLSRKLEALRTGAGIKLERHLVFATARKA